MYGWIVAILSNIYFVQRREDTSKKTTTTDYDGPILPSLFDKGKYHIKLPKMIYSNNNTKKMRKYKLKLAYNYTTSKIQNTPM